MPEERIELAPPGVSSHFRPEGERADLGQPYVLTVATLEPRKNLETLLAAHRLLERDLLLAVAGPPGWGPEVELERAGVRGLGYVTDEELARLYRGAEAFVFPARFEGFGIPVVEAMASGTPDGRLVARVAGRRERQRGRPGRPRFARGDRGGNRGGDPPARGARPRRGRPCARLHLGGHGPGFPGGLLETLGTMRVGIDISALALTRAGTARYLQELLPRLRHRVDLVQLAFGGPGRVTAAVRDAAWYPLGLPRRARRAGIDLLHCPTFRAPFRPPVPLVVTVFDLAILRYPEAFNRWTRTYSRFFVPRAVSAAARVITISDFTRREVTELLGVPEERIRVIPLAAGDAFGTAGAAADGDYVLAVGTLEPRKNLARLAEGARRAGLELRVVGARGWGGVQADGAGVRWLGHVPDAELAELYRGALCVAYPSLYEGFGLPVLEAMACGAPVVTSRGSATEEIADGAAVLVDPADPASIAAGLEEAIGRREELGRLGRERAAGFSWDRVAEQTVDVYRELA